MPERQSNRDSLRVRPGQPLIGVMVRESGQHVTRYFTESTRELIEQRDRAESSGRRAWPALGRNSTGMRWTKSFTGSDTRASPPPPNSSSKLIERRFG